MIEGRIQLVWGDGLADLQFVQRTIINDRCVPITIIGGILRYGRLVFANLLNVDITVVLQATMALK